MTLRSTSFDWQFMPIAGQTFTDTGTTNCHGAPVANTTAPFLAFALTEPSIPAPNTAVIPRQARATRRPVGRKKRR